MLPVVRKSEQEFANDVTLNKEYLPVLGIPDFTRGASTMLLGEDSPAVQDKRVKMMYLIY